MCHGRAVAPPAPLPSPTPSSSSWGKLLQRIADLTSGSPPPTAAPFPPKAAEGQPALDSDSDYGSLDSDSDSLTDDPYEEFLCADVMQLIEQSLSDAKRGALRCFKLLIPDRLTAQVAEELLRLAAGEPCGLRGAVLHLSVEEPGGCKDVDRIVVDASLPPTFELTLVLRLEAGLWSRIQDLLSSGPSFTPGYSQALRLSPHFTIIKRKLYSSTGLFIEEC
ncbi:DNA damage-inducible transcript 4 protein [Chiloscyllium plagiosum]|uniref:DNA damage-inducible transcript 4 protein n=1 Tax=Chiloscyllium plagiosum TaxID=36176 RepID=UPI001CB87995|nr:DNA damage-inducible transcript 4 protein [Chiloscyllium plagiosum]